MVAGWCFEDVEGERGESSRAVGPGGVGGARRADAHVGILGRDAGEREGDASEETRRARAGRAGEEDGREHARLRVEPRGGDAEGAEARVPLGQQRRARPRGVAATAPDALDDDCSVKSTTRIRANRALGAGAREERLLRLAAAAASAQPKLVEVERRRHGARAPRRVRLKS